MNNSFPTCRTRHQFGIRNILILIGIFTSLFTITSVSPGQCTLVITDPPAVCSPATVDLTNPAITAGSTAGLTFTYWKDEAATLSLANPSSAPSGTYYIKGTGSAGCSMIKPVVATVTERPFAEISYPGSPYCNTSAPVSVILTGAMGGIFSASPAGLAIDGLTGTISPVSSSPGIYIVSYTLPASGGCPSVVSTATVVITAPPYAMIDYTGAPFCTVHAPVDVVLIGTTGGIFSASPAGLVIDPATGLISPQSSLPGPYTVSYTLSTSLNCLAFTSSIHLTINPLLTPTFNPIGPLRQNSVPPYLPAVSTNGISGTWNPAILNTTAEGTFTYTFTPDAGQCAQPVSMAVTVVPSSGIESTDNRPDFHVYPNPNHGIFTFGYRSSLTSPIRMSVVDMTGKVICDQNFTDGSGIREIIRMPEGAKGIYLIRVISDAGVIHQKIVVE